MFALIVALIVISVATSDREGRARAREAQKPLTKWGAGFLVAIIGVFVIWR